MELTFIVILILAFVAIGAMALLVLYRLFAGQR
jgi:hypothetical protein